MRIERVIEVRNHHEAGIWLFIPQKYRLIFTGLQGALSHKIEDFSTEMDLKYDGKVWIGFMWRRIVQLRALVTVSLKC
jgi:hypothetical protein